MTKKKNPEDKKIFKEAEKQFEELDKYVGRK